MSDTNEPVTDTSEPPAAIDDAAGETTNPGREAARYRRQLREAEAERDTLRGRVEAMQRAEVERMAGDLAKPSAIWAGGVELAALLDDEGNLDPEKVTEAVDGARESLGLAAAPRAPRPDLTQGSHGGHSLDTGEAMAAILQGRT